MVTTAIIQTEVHRNQLLEEARRHRLAQVASGPRPHRRWRKRLNQRTPAVARRWPVALAIVGLAVMGVSAVTLALTLKAGETRQVPVTPVLDAAGGPAEVATAELVYEPGHSSGWHVHSGVHSVVVLSGTLAFYNETCGRRDYGPGETYLGGRAPHMAHNTGADAVRVAVTYVSDPSAHVPGAPVAAPIGCEAA